MKKQVTWADFTRELRGWIDWHRYTIANRIQRVADRVNVIGKEQVAKRSREDSWANK